MADSIGGRIRLARQAKGLSQARLAQLAGVSQGTIANVENGHRKQPRALIAIAQALGTDPARLLDGGGEQVAGLAAYTAAVGGPWSDLEKRILIAANVLGQDLDGVRMTGRNVRQLLAPHSVAAVCGEGLAPIDAKAVAADLMASVCIELLRAAPPEVRQRVEKQLQARLAFLAET